MHSYNYADLPLWDMLFGTFRNPRTWEARCGFGEANEHRLLEMLFGVDVNKTPVNKTTSMGKPSDEETGSVVAGRGSAANEW